MRLEVNGHTAAEEADADAIRYAVGDLHPTTETSILLHDADNVLLRADGVPKRGFALSYVNPNTGVELISTNNRLKPRSVMRVMKHYLAGDESWRIDVAWQPATEKAAAIQKAAARKRALPILFVLLVFALSFVPLVFGTKAALDELVFKPLCARHNPEVLHYSHGDGGGLTDFSSGSSPATCWYADNSSIALERIIGDGASLLDTLARIGEAFFPLILILLILIAVTLFRRHSPAR